MKVVINDYTYDLDVLRETYILKTTKIPLALLKKMIDEYRRNTLMPGFHVDFGWFLLGVNGDGQYEMLWCEAHWETPEPVWQPWPKASGFYWFKLLDRPTQPKIVKVELYNSNTPDEDFMYYFFGCHEAYYGLDLRSDDDTYEFYGPIKLP